MYGIEAWIRRNVPTAISTNCSVVSDSGGEAGIFPASTGTLNARTSGSFTAGTTSFFCSTEFLDKVVPRFEALTVSGGNPCALGVPQPPQFQAGAWLPG